jgi:SAM-dependent methyltransferase
VKPRLLEVLRCPACRSRVVLTEVMRDGSEITGGRLDCSSCPASYQVRDGVPRMIADGSSGIDGDTRRTGARFGYLWSRSEPTTPSSTRSYHFEKMATSLGLAEPCGLVLDAGCGDGIDLAKHGARPDVEIIGVELSDGGSQTSAARVRPFPAAHVVQADLRRLPFADGTFDRVYSYGVLHHLPSPDAGASEMARVLRPGGRIAVYVYEDFGGRAWGWRWALRLANGVRPVTTRLPPPILFRVCQVLSPVVYVAFTVPHRMLKAVPWTRPFAMSLPFRHGQRPLGLAGDLFDRFSAPIEVRYSREGAGDLLRRAGLDVVKVAYERGWMVSGCRPCS